MRDVNLNVHPKCGNRQPDYSVPGVTEKTDSLSIIIPGKLRSYQYRHSEYFMAQKERSNIDLLGLPK